MSMEIGGSKKKDWEVMDYCRSGQEVTRREMEARWGSKGERKRKRGGVKGK